MRFFEYPYVIITVLAIGIVIMGIIGLYFTMKSVRTANSAVAKAFCSIGKIQSNFEKAINSRKKRCVVFACVSLDGMNRLFAESKAIRLYEEIGKVLLKYFCYNSGGEIAHYSKNSFVMLSELDSNEITLCIDNCFKEINEILVSNGVVNIVQVNFGYFCTNSTEVSFKTALSRSKQACSMAEDKDVLYCRWDNSDVKEFERKIKMENNIQGEIENNRFFLEYQPIIDAKTEKFIGAEVLSRLNSSTDGVLTPRSFLSAVNNVGLNDKFDYYIFEKNCKWISNDKEQRSKYVFTINFSRSTFCDKDFADNIINIVEKCGCDYSNIALEILEDKNLSETERRIMTQNLKILKQKGVLILLDDFGKGFTTFGDLAEFDINIVKIDKSITQSATNDTGFLILKNIIKTAHDLSIKTLCEGIETKEQKDLAISAGCDMLQGHYFYKPMRVAQFEELFKS